MAYRKAAKITLTDLDQASKEYEALLKKAEETFAVWDSSKDTSYELIAEIETLASSISHAPFTISRKLKRISVQKEEYKGRETIEREKRKEELAAGAGAVAVLGAGAAAALSFWDYIKDWVFKKTGGKMGKNLVLWLVVAVIFLVAALFLWISWAITRKREAIKAAKNTKKLRKEIAALQKKEATAETLISEITEQVMIVNKKLEVLQQFTGMQYKDLPKDAQVDLVAMVNDAVALSELINRDFD